MKISKISFFRKCFVILGILVVISSQVVAGDVRKSAVLTAMESELSRSMKELSKKAEQPPYFISYRVTDTSEVILNSSFGAIKEDNRNRFRILDVDVRVGDYVLDNTHPIRGSRYGINFSSGSPEEIAIEDDIAALKSFLWLETDKRFKAALENFIKLQTDQAVTVEEEDTSDDFSRESPRKYIGPPVDLSPEIEIWKRKVRQYSDLFSDFSDIYDSDVSLRAEAVNKYLTNSEGTVIQQGRTYWYVVVSASTKADDGMELYKTCSFGAHNAENLPDDRAIEAAVHRLIKELQALREAPVMEPYTGPAILTGRAAGVFLHEIFGHRVEGHRQKDEREGQTFTKKINQKILPEFISVSDDPTRKQHDGRDLSGYYLYDDEGVKAEAVTVVKDGILKNFLMSRSPIKGFNRSNGHGRAQAGRRPVSRQGNLMIHSSKTVPQDRLRRMLIDECKAQNKPYGLLFEDISGGFTYTGRYLPQSFNVTPIIVYRVYADGRPDELVRGVDLIGTPLTSFSKILACGDRLEVFNGYCGAESGAVPVSVVAPSILTGQIEVQKKEKSAGKPPVLPPPDRDKKNPSTSEADKDVVLEALQDEMDRSVKHLHIENMDKPYYIQYSVYDRQGVTIEASFGALIQSDRHHNRLLKVGVRVGDYQLDNSGFIGRNSLFSASGGNPERMVLEDDYHAVRRDIWLVTDATFKHSLQQMAQKRAFRQNQVQDEEIPDFSREKAVRIVEPVREIEFNPERWEDLVRRLSLIFRRFPAIQQSAVNLNHSVTIKYYVNSEGSVCRYPHLQTSLIIRASTQAADGSKLKHHLPYYAVSLTEIPSEKEIAAAVHRLAGELTALAAAPKMDDFIGPALFTGQASAELFAQLLTPHLSGERPPESEVPQMSEMTGSSKLAHRLNRRVLPSFMTVIDDSTRSDYEGRKLLGTYAVDDEGVIPRPLTLIEKGILRKLLMSRRPRKEIPGSNGHGRESLWGSVGAQIGNLFVHSETGKSCRDLKNELMQMCRDQKLSFGLLIKTLDNPAVTGTDESVASLYVRASKGSEDELSSPVGLYRVYAEDGREELVRGLNVRDLDVKALKYITSAGSDYYLLQRLMPPGSGMMRRLFSVYARRLAGFGIPAAVIAPSVLFEEVEFMKISDPLKRLPLLGHPYFSRK